MDPKLLSELYMYTTENIMYNINSSTNIVYVSIGAIVSIHGQTLLLCVIIAYKNQIKIAFLYLNSLPHMNWNLPQYVVLSFRKLKCKTVESPQLTQRSHCSLSLSHRYILTQYMTFLTAARDHYCLAKWPVTRKMFPFDDVIMCALQKCYRSICQLQARHCAL